MSGKKNTRQSKIRQDGKTNTVDQNDHMDKDDGSNFPPKGLVNRKRRLEAIVNPEQPLPKQTRQSKVKNTKKKNLNTQDVNNNATTLATLNEPIVGSARSLIAGIKNKQAKRKPTATVTKPVDPTEQQPATSSQEESAYERIYRKARQNLAKRKGVDDYSMLNQDPDIEGHTISAVHAPDEDELFPEEETEDHGLLNRSLQEFADTDPSDSDDEITLNAREGDRSANEGP